jgi:hypothetical protein
LRYETQEDGGVDYTLGGEKTTSAKRSSCLTPIRFRIDNDEAQSGAKASSFSMPFALLILWKKTRRYENSR